jgi:hypothetical protein
MSGLLLSLCLSVFTVVQCRIRGRELRQDSPQRTRRAQSRMKEGAYPDPLLSLWALWFNAGLGSSVRCSERGFATRLASRPANQSGNHPRNHAGNRLQNQLASDHATQPASQTAIDLRNRLPSRGRSRAADPPGNRGQSCLPIAFPSHRGDRLGNRSGNGSRGDSRSVDLGDIDRA